MRILSTMMDLCVQILLVLVTGLCVTLVQPAPTPEDSDNLQIISDKNQTQNDPPRYNGTETFGGAVNGTNGTV